MRCRPRSSRQAHLPEGEVLAAELGQHAVEQARRAGEAALGALEPADDRLQHLEVGGVGPGEPQAGHDLGGQGPVEGLLGGMAGAGAEAGPPQEPLGDAVAEALAGVVEAAVEVHEELGNPGRYRLGLGQRIEEGPQVIGLDDEVGGPVEDLGRDRQRRLVEVHGADDDEVGRVGDLGREAGLGTAGVEGHPAAGYLHLR